MSSNVDASRTLPGRLRKKGRRVRTTSAITSSVSNDSTNQPVRNPADPGVKPSRSDANVRHVEGGAEQTELEHEASDEAHVPTPGMVDELPCRHYRPAMPKAGMSERKLFSRICPASSGRNGRKRDAMAMLTMLPRFALVVVRMYLSVLAKVRLPSFDSSTNHVEVPLEQDEVGRLACDLDRGVDRDTRVGRMHGRRVIDAVPHEPNHMSTFAKGSDDALLLIGIDLHEQVRSLRGSRQSASS